MFILVGIPISTYAEAEACRFSLLAALLRWLRTGGATVEAGLKPEGVHTFATFIRRRFYLATRFERLHQTLIQFHPLVLEGCSGTLLNNFLVVVGLWVDRIGIRIILLA